MTRPTSGCRPTSSEAAPSSRHVRHRARGDSERRAPATPEPIREPSRRCVPRTTILFSVSVVLQGCSFAFLPWNRPPTVQTTFQGEYVQVACHFSCGNLGPAALDTADEAWTLVASYLDTHQDVRRSAEPPASVDPVIQPRPTIHLYGSLRAYELAEDRIAGGRFRLSAGFSDRPSASAHLMVPEKLSSGLVERVGLPDHYRRIVAHEAAHLAAYQLAGGAHWPLWLAEGLAGWIERTVVTRGGRLPVQEHDPWASTRLWRVQNLLFGDALPSVPDIVLETPMELASGDAYAVWIELFHFLDESPWREDVRDLVRSLAREAGSGAAELPAVVEAVRERFDLVRLDELEAAFHSHVEALHPGWVEVFRALERLPGDTEEWTQHSLVDVQVGPMAWRAVEAASPEGFVLEGTVEVLTEGSWEVRWLVENRDQDPLMVAMDARGRVEIREFTYETADQPSILARSRAAVSLATGVPFDFSLDVRPGRISLRVESRRSGETSVEIEVPELRPTGLWGLGLDRGTTAIWGGLEKLDRPESIAS